MHGIALWPLRGSIALEGKRHLWTGVNILPGYI